MFAAADDVATRNPYDILSVPDTQVEGECSPWLHCICTNTLCLVNMFC